MKKDVGKRVLIGMVAIIMTLFGCQTTETKNSSTGSSEANSMQQADASQVESAAYELFDAQISETQISSIASKTSQSKGNTTSDTGKNNVSHITVTSQTQTTESGTSSDKTAAQDLPVMLKKAIPDRTVVLTFDDALKNHYNNVAPELKARGFHATFYVSELYFSVYGAANYADGVNKGVYMTWNEIAALEKQGFEIGNHSMTHHNLPGMSKSEMKKEIDGIADRCAANQIARPKTFAYPGLSYTSASLDYLQSQGYTFARTGLADTYDPLTQHPLKVMGADAHLDYANFVKQVEKAKDGKIVVLLYHDVPNRSAFAKTMDYLKSRQFTVLSMKQLEEYIDPQLAAKYFKEHPDAAIPLPQYTEGKERFSIPGDLNLGTQGLEGFYYMYALEGEYQYADPMGGYWGLDATGEEYCRITTDMMHPGNKAHPVLKWKAPKSGKVNLSGTAEVNNSSADGVKLTIYKEKVKLKEVILKAKQPAEIQLSCISITEKESFYLELDGLSNNGSDTTNLRLEIIYS